MTAHPAQPVPWTLRCVETGHQYPGDDPRYRSDSGAILEAVHTFAPFRAANLSLADFDQRRASRDPIDRSGVWRFRELILPVEREHIVSRGEGNTTLYDAPSVAAYAGLAPPARLLLKHEGENPTASFKDRGMTVGVTMARRLGAHTVACASTGNTSASMASYAAIAGMRALVFIPEGNISLGKLSQALAYGARTIQIRGNFDDAMRLVEQLCTEENVYLLNSLNPFRLEGQKAIAFEILQDLGWNVPDWIVCPGGNLGNSSAIFKGLSELHALGLIDKLPRIAVIQAAGANPLYHAFTTRSDTLAALPNPETIATAIRIGAPVSFRKSLNAVLATRGIVDQATDQEIMDAKAIIDRAGIGCEPASAATVAGIRHLTANNTIGPGETVVGVLTGHLLKDPDATAKYHARQLHDKGIDPAFPNAPIKCEPTMDAIRHAIAEE